LHKAENDDMGDLQVSSVKNIKIRGSVPRDHCICCCLRRNSVQWHGIVEIADGWREQEF